MKKISLLLSIASLLLVSCSKNFLKESAPDLVRPTTADALNQLLMGEAYPVDMIFHSYYDMLDDDVQANYTNLPEYMAIMSKYAPVFTWQPDMHDQLKQLGSFGSDTYQLYYQKIKGCNVVLDNVDKVSGSDADRANVKGQALALRAYLYFMLVNFYGKPYGVAGSNPASDPGVPLLLSAEVTDAAIARASVKQVYEQMEKDVLEAVDLLPAMGTKNSIYRMTNTAAALLASRIFLYKQDWQNCIKYANMAIGLAPALKDLNTVTSPFGISSPLIAGAEVIWVYGSAGEYTQVLGSAPNSSSIPPYTVSDDLYSIFATNDLRRTLYFQAGAYLTSTAIVSYRKTTAKNGTATSGKAFRVSEAYLNRAEANIQLAMSGNAQGAGDALTDLNLLRRNRIAAATYSDTAITDLTGLYAFCKAERRRELCFEDHRWFDLRRWATSELKHIYQADATVQTITLQPGDSRYTLRLPQDALTRNPNLTQNP